MYTSAIVLSECIKIRHEMAIFHFKGFFQGVKIVRLEIRLSKNCEQIKVKEIYLLFVRINAIENSTLNCEVLKCFSWDEIQDRDNFNLEYEHLLNHQP